MTPIARRALLRAALLGAALTPGWSAAAQAICEIFPGDGERRFLVLRHDQVLGEHRFNFARKGDTFTVRTDVAFSVGPARAPLYRYEHHSEEMWRDGWLQSVVSDTDRNGERWRLRMERREKALSGSVNGQAITVSGYLIPTSLWHRDTPSVEALFSVVDGFPKLITSHDLGERAVTFQGETLTARGHRIRGGLVIDLWYDGRCRLVRAAFPLFDGGEAVLEAA